MLKFKRIGLKANKIDINKKKRGGGLFGGLFQKKEDNELQEFDRIMRSLVMLIEFDKTYPTSKKFLINLRKTREEKKNTNVVQKISFKKALKGVGNIFSGAKNMLRDIGKIAEGVDKKKKKAKSK